MPPRRQLEIPLGRQSWVRFVSFYLLVITLFVPAKAFGLSLDFPINPPDKDAYKTAPINTVFDHSNKSKEGKPWFYSCDQQVVAFNGDMGNIDPDTSWNAGSCLDDPTLQSKRRGYQNQNGSAFNFGSYAKYNKYNYLYYDGHPGFDYNFGQLIPIYAPAPGMFYLHPPDPVNGSGSKWNSGKLDHGYGWETWYLHTERYVVTNGQIVKRGELIGYVGTTGIDPPAYHLHFEVRKNGIPMDPYGWLWNNTPIQDPYQSSGHGTNIFVWNHTPGQADPAIRWHPNGTLVRGRGDTKVYLLDSGGKSWVTTLDLFDSYAPTQLGYISSYGFDWHKIIEVDMNEINCYPPAALGDLISRPRIVKGPSQDDVFLIVNGKFKKKIHSPVVFERLGYTWEDIYTISDLELSNFTNHPISPVLYSTYPDGTLIKKYGDGKIYVITEGQKRHISTDVIFSKLGYLWIDVVQETPGVVDAIPEIIPSINENVINICDVAPAPPQNLRLIK